MYKLLLCRRPFHVHIFIIKCEFSLFCVGIGAEEHGACYTRQVLCPLFESSCYENITGFAAFVSLGANTTYKLTFNSSAIQLSASRYYEVSLQSSCSVAEISLESGDECSLLSIDEDRNSISFTCGRVGIRGTTANAGVILFTPSDPMHPSCVGNGTTVLVVVQRGEGGSGGTEGGQNEIHYRK